MISFICASVATLFLCLNGLEMLGNNIDLTTGSTNETSKSIYWTRNSSIETERNQCGSENITENCPQFDDVVHTICYIFFSGNCSALNSSRNIFNEYNSECIFQNLSFEISINMLHSFCSKVLLTTSKTGYSNKIDNERKNDSTHTFTTSYPNTTFIRYNYTQNETEIMYHQTDNITQHSFIDCYPFYSDKSFITTETLGNIDYVLRFLFCFNSYNTDFGANNMSRNNVTKGINFIRNCYLNCESFESTSHCVSCKSGSYGDYCHQMCSKYCNDNECDHSSGICEPCLSGWYGNKCDQHCLSNCAICLDNSTCIECTDGFFGRYCEHRCPEDCKRCSRNGKTCDICKSEKRYGEVCQCRTSECTRYSPSLYCLECKQSGWYVSWVGCCPCSHHCAEGSDSCDNATGACLDGCLPGYYGQKCDDKCSDYCIGNDPDCHSLTGDCESGCEKDWALSSCTYECSMFYPYCAKCANFSGEMKCSECIQGYYMPQKYRLTSDTTSYLSDYCVPCDHCLNNDCGGSSGLCLEGCKIRGRYNAIDPNAGQTFCSLDCDTCAGKNCNFTDGSCLDGCEQGYHGDKCEFKCSKTCHNQICKQSSGECHSCMFGYYGSTCDYTCGQCSDVICDILTGNCNGECLRGYYGPKCDKACRNCVGHVCEVDGRCLYGCMPGTYTPHCNINCPVKCFACHPVDGTCIINDVSEFGTQFTGFNISKSVCQHGRYGINCSTYCEAGCKKRSETLPQCDKYTGYCPVCLKGYHGHKCEDGCNTTCINGDCSRNGTCLRGCIDRWQGIYCQNNFPVTIFEQYSGILFGFLCFSTFTITLLFVVLNIRNEQQKKSLKHKVTEQYHHADHENVTFV